MTTKFTVQATRQTRNAAMAVAQVFLLLCVGCIASSLGKDKDVQADAEKALLADDRGAMEALLNDGLSPDAMVRVDGVTRPLLHSAALAGRAHVAKLLLHRGANKENRDKFGYLPIEYALQARNSQVVRLLSRQAVAFTSLTGIVEHVVQAIVAKDRPQVPRHTVAIIVDCEGVVEDNNIVDAQRGIAPPAASSAVGFTVKIWQHHVGSDTWDYSVTRLDSGVPVQRRDGIVHLVGGYWIATDNSAVDY